MFCVQVKSEKPYLDTLTPLFHLSRHVLTFLSKHAQSPRVLSMSRHDPDALSSHLRGGRGLGVHLASIRLALRSHALPVLLPATLRISPVDVGLPNYPYLPVFRCRTKVLVRCDVGTNILRCIQLQQVLHYFFLFFLHLH